MFGCSALRSLLRESARGFGCRVDIVAFAEGALGVKSVADDHASAGPGHSLCPSSAK